MKHLLSFIALLLAMGSQAQQTVGLMQYTTPPSGYLNLLGSGSSQYVRFAVAR